MTIRPDKRTSELTYAAGQVSDFNLVEGISTLALKGAHTCLAALIILAPVRYRWVVEARPAPPIYKDYTDYLIFSSDVAIVAVLVLWGIARLFQRQKLHLGPFFLTYPLLGLTLVAGIGSFTSIDPGLSLYHTLRLVALLGLYFFLVNDPPDSRLILVSTLGAAGFQALLAITQVLEQSSLGLQGWGEYLLDPAWEGVSIVWATGVRSLRAYGLSDHPNILGGHLAFSLVLLVGCVGIRYSGKAQSPWLYLFGGISGLGFTALLLTFSRAAWLGFLTGAMILIVGMLYWGQYGQVKNLAGLLLCSVLMSAPFIWHNGEYLIERANVLEMTPARGNEFRALNERMVLFTAANQIFSEHAVSGTGLGSSPQALLEHDPDLLFDYQPPHNALLAAAVETGIFGALFYGAAVALPLLAAGFRLIKSKAASPAGNQFLVFSALLGAIAVVGLFDYYTWLLTTGRIWQFAAWGLWAAAWMQIDRDISRVVHA